MMEIIIIDSGQRQLIALTDYICTWVQEHDPERMSPYDLGVVTVMEATAGERGSKKLSGKIRAYCPICGRVHEAVRQHCEIEFKESACPDGHKSWQAQVVSLKRRDARWGDTDSSKDVAYEFVVELHCTKCKKMHRRLTQSVTGALGSIKKVVIGIEGIEFERN